MDRRRFLALCAAGASVLALPAAAEDRVAFDPDDAAVVRELFRAIYGSGADAVDVVRHLEETLPYVAADKHDLIRMLPGIVDEVSRVLVPSVSAWRDLGEADRVAALEDWGTSPLELRRTVYHGLRRMLLAVAYCDPATWVDIGYPGPWLGRMVLPVHPLRFGPLSPRTLP
ncbi:MAG: hypothetical protein ACOZNI_06315 [Myxococcota bacterium]